MTLLLLMFALVYHFAGDRLFPARDFLHIDEGEIIVSFIDVGQGDAVLIRSADNAILIDGGEHRQRNVVLDYLRDAGVRKLDYVIATHPHSDHIGGLVTVLGRVEVGRVIMPDIEHNTETYLNFLAAIENNNIPVTFPEPGDRIRAGIINLTVLSPPQGHFTDPNNNSVSVRLVHGNTSFIFTGDAERAAEQWMVDSGVTLRSDVLRVGHHGSNTSTTEAFLDAVDPVAAVIQVGENNRHGHPHPDVMDRLTSRGIAIYRTDELGTIRMITNGQRIYFP